MARTRMGMWAGLIVGLCGAAASAAPINLVPFYADSAGEGFNDPTLGAQRKAAFEAALNRWSQYLTASYSGETLTVLALMNPQGGTATSAPLGSGSPMPPYLYANYSNMVPNVWYGAGLANHLQGVDLNPTYPEIGVILNSDLDNSTVLGNGGWYYGLDGQPNGNVDFFSVALHEIGHGLNFSSLIGSDGKNYTYTQTGDTNPLTLPGIYDHFLVEGETGGTPLDSMTDSQRAAAIASDDIFWDGQHGIDGNGGNLPKLYAPNPFVGGTSLLHTDQDTYPDTMMIPYYAGVVHTPSAMELGMLQDMGWTVPEPTGLALLAVGGVLLMHRRRRVA